MVSFIIKTFERPKVLDRLIVSIRKFYDYPIIVADDSKNPVVRDDVEYYTMPYDSGLCAGRNLLISQVKTKYFVLLDDDFIFTAQTDIDKMVELLEKHDLDILAGEVNNSGKVLKYSFNLFRTGADVYYKDVERGEEVTVAEIVPFFFISKPDIAFDPQFKICEHLDFFLSIKGKKKVASTEMVKIDHWQVSPSPEYRAKRFTRKPEFYKLLLDKHNLDYIYTPYGTISRAVYDVD